MIAGQIEIQMLAEIMRLKKSMDEANDIVRSRAMSMQRAADVAGKAIGGMLAGLSVAAFSAWMKSAIDAGDATKAFAQKTGVAAKDVAGLQLAFKQGGVDGDMLTASIAKMSKQMAEGNAGFKRLGVETRNADGTLRNVKDVLYDTADAFATIKNGAALTATATEIFGKSGAAMIPTLAEGADGLREMAEMATKLGLVIDADAADAADKFNDTTELLGLGLQGVARQAMAQLLPALNSLAGGFLTAMTEGDALRQVANVLASGMQVLYAVFVGGVQVVNTFGKTLGAMGGQLVALLSGDFKAVRDIGNAWMSDIKGDWTSTVKNIGDVWTGSAAQTVEAGSNMLRAQRALKLASKEAEAAANKAAAAEAKRAEEARKLIAGLEAANEAHQRELDTGVKLSAAQREALALMQRLRDGTLVLTDAEKRRLVVALEAKLAAEAQTSAELALAAATLEASKARDTMWDALVKESTSLADQVEQQRLANEATLTGIDRTNELAVSKLREAAASAERKALVALERNEDLAQYEALKQIAAQLRELAELKERAPMVQAARDAADAWQNTADTIAGGLADAFVRGIGKGKSLFVELRDFVTGWLTQLAQVQLQGSISQALGGSAGGAGNASSTVSLATSLYNSGGTAGGLYGSAAAAGNYAAVYSGQAYGTGLATQQSAMLAAQEAGMVSSAGSSTMGSWATSAGWVAAIALGVWKANQDYSDGFNAQGAEQVSRDTGGLVGKLESTKADILGRLGMSDRWASLLSGSTAVAKIFGRADPRVEGSGLQGFLGSGDFAGNSYADIVEKGGLFRSDKRYQQLGEVPDEIGRLMDNSAGELLKKAQDYGSALGLPVDRLGQVTTEIKVALTDDADANLKAIVEALGGYGDALVAGWADAMAPLAAYGETTADTLARVGAALLGVGNVLDAIGAKALSATVEGGAAAVALADLFGGIDALNQQGASYYQAYFTEAERAAAASAYVTDALASVGLAMPTTIQGFRDLVEAQDPMSESGRQALAVLLQVDEAFAALVPPVRSVLDITNERLGLEGQWLTLVGDTAELRRRELETIDPSNRALQTLIWALQDEQAAADLAADATATAADELRRLGDAWDAAAGGMADGVRAAFQAVQQTIAAERQRVEQQADDGIRTAQQQADALTAALDDQRRAVDQQAATDLKALEAQASRISAEFGSLLQSLASSVQSLQGQLAGDGGRADAMGTLRSALAALRSGQGVDMAAVQDAAGTASRIDGSAFATKVEADRATAATANLVREVASAARGQMTRELSAIALQQVQIEAARDATLQAIALQVAEAERNAADTISAITSARDLQLAALDDQLAQAREAAGSLVSIDDGITTVASTLSALASAMGAMQLMTGQGGPTGQILQNGNTQVYGSTTGAVVSRTAGDGWDKTLVRGRSGALTTADVVRREVAALVGSGNWARIVDVALAEGIDSNTLDGLMDWAPGTALMEAARRGLPSFATGTNFVPDDMVANLHRGERVVPAADNAEFLRVLQGGGDTAEMARELRALREEVAGMHADTRAGLTAVATHTSKSAALADRWDGEGLPPTRS